MSVIKKYKSLIKNKNNLKWRREALLRESNELIRCRNNFKKSLSDQHTFDHQKKIGEVPNVKLYASCGIEAIERTLVNQKPIIAERLRELKKIKSEIKGVDDLLSNLLNNKRFTGGDTWAI